MCGRRKVSKAAGAPAQQQHGQRAGFLGRRRIQEGDSEDDWVRRTSIKRDKQEENIWQGNKFSLENIEYRLPWIFVLSY